MAIKIDTLIPLLVKNYPEVKDWKSAFERGFILPVIRENHTPYFHDDPEYYRASIESYLSHIDFVTAGELVTKFGYITEGDLENMAKKGLFNNDTVLKTPYRWLFNKNINEEELRSLYDQYLDIMDEEKKEETIYDELVREQDEEEETEPEAVEEKAENDEEDDEEIIIETKSKKSRKSKRDDFDANAELAREKEEYNKEMREQYESAPSDDPYAKKETNNIGYYGNFTGFDKADEPHSSGDYQSSMLEEASQVSEFIEKAAIVDIVTTQELSQSGLEQIMDYVLQTGTPVELPTADGSVISFEHKFYGDNVAVSVSVSSTVEDGLYTETVKNELFAKTETNQYYGKGDLSTLVNEYSKRNDFPSIEVFPSNDEEKLSEQQILFALGAVDVSKYIVNEKPDNDYSEYLKNVVSEGEVSAETLNIISQYVQDNGINISIPVSDTATIVFSGLVDEGGNNVSVSVVERPEGGDPNDPIVSNVFDSADPTSSFSNIVDAWNTYGTSGVNDSYSGLNNSDTKILGALGVSQNYLPPTTPLGTIDSYNEEYERHNSYVYTSPEFQTASQVATATLVAEPQTKADGRSYGSKISQKDALDVNALLVIPEGIDYVNTRVLEDAKKAGAKSVLYSNQDQQVNSFDKYVENTIKKYGLSEAGLQQVYKYVDNTKQKVHVPMEDGSWLIIKPAVEAGRTGITSYLSTPQAMGSYAKQELGFVDSYLASGEKVSSYSVGEVENVLKENRLMFASSSKREDLTLNDFRVFAALGMTDVSHIDANVLVGKRQIISQLSDEQIENTVKQYGLTDAGIQQIIKHVDDTKQKIHIPMENGSWLVIKPITEEGKTGITSYVSIPQASGTFTRQELGNIESNKGGKYTYDFNEIKNVLAANKLASTTASKGVSPTANDVKVLEALGIAKAANSAFAERRVPAKSIASEINKIFNEETSKRKVAEKEEKMVSAIDILDFSTLSKRQSISAIRAIQNDYIKSSIYIGDVEKGFGTSASDDSKYFSKVVDGKTKMSAPLIVQRLKYNTGGVSVGAEEVYKSIFEEPKNIKNFENKVKSRVTETAEAVAGILPNAKSLFDTTGSNGIMKQGLRNKLAKISEPSIKYTTEKGNTLLTVNPKLLRRRAEAYTQDCIIMNKSNGAKGINPVTQKLARQQIIKDEAMAGMSKAERAKYKTVQVAKYIKDINKNPNQVAINQQTRRLERFASSMARSTVRNVTGLNNTYFAAGLNAFTVGSGAILISGATRKLKTHIGAELAKKDIAARIHLENIKSRNNENANSLFGGKTFKSAAEYDAAFKKLINEKFRFTNADGKEMICRIDYMSEHRLKNMLKSKTMSGLVGAENDIELTEEQLTIIAEQLSQKRIAKGDLSGEDAGALLKSVGVDTKESYNLGNKQDRKRLIGRDGELTKAIENRKIALAEMGIDAGSLGSAEKIAAVLKHESDPIQLKILENNVKSTKKKIEEITKRYGRLNKSDTLISDIMAKNDIAFLGNMRMGDLSIGKLERMLESSAYSKEELNAIRKLLEIKKSLSKLNGKDIANMSASGLTELLKTEDFSPEIKKMLTELRDSKAKKEKNQSKLKNKRDKIAELKLLHSEQKLAEDIKAIDDKLSTGKIVKNATVAFVRKNGSETYVMVGANSFGTIRKYGTFILSTLKTSAAIMMKPVFLVAGKTKLGKQFKNSEAVQRVLTKLKIPFKDRLKASVGGTMKQAGADALEASKMIAASINNKVLKPIIGDKVVNPLINKHVKPAINNHREKALNNPNKIKKRQEKINKRKNRIEKIDKIRNSKFANLARDTKSKTSELLKKVGGNILNIAEFIKDPINFLIGTLKSRFLKFLMPVLKYGAIALALLFCIITSLELMFGVLGGLQSSILGLNETVAEYTTNSGASLAQDRVDLCISLDSALKDYLQGIPQLDSVRTNIIKDEQISKEAADNNWYLFEKWWKDGKDFTDISENKSSITMGRTVNDIKTGIHYGYYDGDGNEIGIISNAKDIVSCANAWMVDSSTAIGLYKSYVEKLWNFSHIVTYNPRHQENDTENYIYACSVTKDDECWNNKYTYQCNDEDEERVYNDKNETRTEWLNRITPVDENDNVAVSLEYPNIRNYNTDGCQTHEVTYCTGGSRVNTSKMMKNGEKYVYMLYDGNGNASITSGNSLPSGATEIKFYSSASSMKDTKGNACTNYGEIKYKLEGNTYSAYYCMGHSHQNGKDKSSCMDGKFTTFPGTVNENKNIKIECLNEAKSSIEVHSQTAGGETDIEVYHGSTITVNTTDDGKKIAKKVNGKYVPLTSSETYQNAAFGANYLYGAAHDSYGNTYASCSDCPVNHNNVDYYIETKTTVGPDNIGTYKSTSGSLLQCYQVKKWGTKTYKSIKEGASPDSVLFVKATFKDNKIWKENVGVTVEFYDDVYYLRQTGSIQYKNGVNASTENVKCINDQTTQTTIDSAKTWKTYKAYFKETSDVISDGYKEYKTVYSCPGHTVREIVESVDWGNHETLKVLGQCKGYCPGHTFHYCSGHIDMDVSCVTLYLEGRNNLTKLGVYDKVDIYGSKESYGATDYIEENRGKSITNIEMRPASGSDVLYESVGQFKNINFKYQLPVFTEVPVYGEGNKLSTKRVENFGVTQQAMYFFSIGECAGIFNITNDEKDVNDWMYSDDNTSGAKTLDELIKIYYKKFNGDEKFKWCDYNDFCFNSLANISHMSGLNKKFSELKVDWDYTKFEELKKEYSSYLGDGWFNSLSAALNAFDADTSLSCFSDFDGWYAYNKKYTSKNFADTLKTLPDGRDNAIKIGTASIIKKDTNGDGLPDYQDQGPISRALNTYYDDWGNVYYNIKFPGSSTTKYFTEKEANRYIELVVSLHGGSYREYAEKIINETIGQTTTMNGEMGNFIKYIYDCFGWSLSAPDSGTIYENGELKKAYEHLKGDSNAQRIAMIRLDSHTINFNDKEENVLTNIVNNYITAKAGTSESEEYSAENIDFDTIYAQTQNAVISKLAPGDIIGFGDEAYLILYSEVNMADNYGIKYSTDRGHFICVSLNGSGNSKPELVAISCESIACLKNGYAWVRPKNYTSIVNNLAENFGNDEDKTYSNYDYREVSGAIFAHISYRYNYNKEYTGWVAATDEDIFSAILDYKNITTYIAPTKVHADEKGTYACSHATPVRYYTSKTEYKVYYMHYNPETDKLNESPSSPGGCTR